MSNCCTCDVLFLFCWKGQQNRPTSHNTMPSIFHPASSERGCFILVFLSVHTTYVSVEVGGTVCWTTKPILFPCAPSLHRVEEGGNPSSLSPPPLPTSLFFSAADFDASSSSSSSSSSVESGGCGREIPTERKRGKRAAVVSECSDSPARLHLDPPREFSAFIRRQIGQFVPRSRVTRRTKGKSTSVPSGPIFSLSFVTPWCCRQALA